MRVAHLIHQFPPRTHGGAERHCEQLARAQSEWHDVLVYTQSVDHADGAPLIETAGRVSVRRWRDRSPSSQALLAADMAEAFRAFAPDVVHVHHGIGFPPQALAALARDYPCVVTLHDYWWVCPRVTLLYRDASPCPGPAPLSRCSRCYRDDAACAPVGEIAGLASLGAAGRILRSKRATLDARSAETLRLQTGRKFASSALPRRWFFHRRRAAHRDFLRACRAWISPSVDLLRRYEAFGYVKPHRGDVAPYGVELPAERPPRDATRRPIRFVFLGGTARHKGFDLIARTFAAVSPEDATLDIYGAHAAPATLPACARWRGFADPSRHADVWRDADALLAPSIWVENAPKVVSEALASGVPVVAADHGALPEMVGPGRGGFLFAGLDSLSLAAVVERLIDEPSLLDEACARIPAPVSIESAADAVERVYRRIL